MPMQPISVALAAALRWQPQEPNRRDELRDRARCSRRQELLANLHGKLTAFQSFALGGIAGTIAEMITVPAVAVRARLMVQGASAVPWLLRCMPDIAAQRGHWRLLQGRWAVELFERRHLARGVGQGGRRTISERSFTRSD